MLLDIGRGFASFWEIRVFSFQMAAILVERQGLSSYNARRSKLGRSRQASNRLVMGAAPSAELTQHAGSTPGLM